MCILGRFFLGGVCAPKKNIENKIRMYLVCILLSSLISVETLQTYNAPFTRQEVSCSSVSVFQKTMCENTRHLHNDTCFHWEQSDTYLGVYDADFGVWYLCITCQNRHQKMNLALQRINGGPLGCISVAVGTLCRRSCYFHNLHCLFRCLSIISICI